MPTCFLRVLYIPTKETTATTIERTNFSNWNAVLVTILVGPSQPPIIDELVSMSFIAIRKYIALLIVIASVCLYSVNKVIRTFVGVRTEPPPVISKLG